MRSILFRFFDAMIFLTAVVILVPLKIFAVDESPYSLIEFKNSDKIIKFINNPELDLGENVKSLATKEGDIVVNGGYYGKDFKSLGYLKIDNQEINKKLNPGLSGMLLLNSNGILGVNWSKQIVVGEYDGVLQNGPFLIDPGGKLGINTDDGKLANRLCVGRKLNGNIILVYSSRTSLFKLATVVLKDHPDLSELLNMDGGPMAGLWVFGDEKFQFNNAVPAISYIKFSNK